MRVSSSPPRRCFDVEPPERRPGSSRPGTRTGSARSGWLALIVFTAALTVFLLPIPLALRATHAPELAPASSPAPRLTHGLPIEAQFLEEGGLVRPVHSLERLEVPEVESEPADAESADETPEKTNGARPIEALFESAKVSIEVVDEAGRPVPGARVELLTIDEGTDIERRLVRATGPEGRVHVETPPGWCEVVAWGADASGGPSQLELERGRSVHEVLVLRPSLGVSGRIVEAGSGRPIPGAEVSFWTFSEKDVVHSASDGTFRHPRFPAGTGAQQVRALAAGYGATVRYLDVSVDGWRLLSPLAAEDDDVGTGEPWVEISLAPELVVAGTVHDAAGDPLPGARVTVEGFFHVLPELASRDAATTLADPEGRFVLEGLRSDVSHALVVTAERHAAATLELPVGASTDDLVLHLGVETVLSGVVVDPDGVPAEDIEVVAHPVDVAERATSTDPSGLDAGARIEGRIDRVRTDAEGTFAFSSLVPGPYVVQVTGDAGLLVEERVILGDVSTPAALELRLPAESRVLVGLVRGDHGAIPNARVDVRRDGHVSSVVADETGHFRVAGLDAAQYELVTSGRCPRTGMDLEGVLVAWSHDRPVVRVGPR